MSPNRQSNRSPDEAHADNKADAEARLSAIVEGSGDAIISTLLDGTVTSWNRSAELLYGYSAADAIGRNIEMIYPSDQRVQLESIMQTIWTGGRLEPIIGRRKRQDGVLVDAEVRVSPIFDTSGNVVGLSAIAHDIGDRAQLERERQEDRDFLKWTQELSGVGAWRVGLDEESSEHWTAEMYEIFGVTPGTPLIARDFFSFVHPADRKIVTEAGARILAHRQSEEVEYRIVRPDGAVRWISGVTAARIDDSGELVGLAGACRDITDTKEAEARLAHDSLHDPLTGLPNRALLLDRLERALQRSKSHDHYVAIHFVDLDRFKLQNDARGHDHGDAVLRAVAKRLLLTSHASDTVGRLSGDEFVVVSEEIENVDQATERVETLHASFSDPFEIAGMPTRVHASIGVALSQIDSTPESLLRDADLAMYRAKEKGSNRFEFYDEALRLRAEQRMALEADLWQALDKGELFLEFQPIVALDKAEFFGVEALMRWQHPERGLVEPNNFIAIAEETGLIVPMGNWILENAMLQMREWHDNADALGIPPHLHLSVNVSPVHLRARDFIYELQALLEHTRLDPGYLKLEITESILLDANLARELLPKIHELGVHISIDDFGAGYSSLSYLRQLPIDELKIDRSFVSHLTEEDSSRAIVAAIIGIGQSLDLHVTAEGVETSSQLETLRKLGCEAAQGFYFSQSLIARACLETLHRGVPNRQ